MVNQQERAEIYKLFTSGLSVPQISARVNRSTTTIYNLLKNNGPKYALKSSIELPKKIMQFKKFLDDQIKYGVTNARKLFIEIKQQGYPGSYSLVNNYVRSFSKNTNSNYKPSIHFETKPGEQAQIDWGHFGKIEINGRLEKLYCFVYILGFSRAIYIEFVVKQNLQTLEDCHIHAFESLGIPQTIVYDNMKTVVLSREKLLDGTKKIHYNPAFLDFAKFYGFEIKACPPYWPRAKGKVEASVKYIRNNFMQGLDFSRNSFSLAKLNEKAKHWVDNVASVRIHASTRERPSDSWLKEKPLLRFPKDFPQYSLSFFTERKATKDAMIQYKLNFYSVPMQFAGKKLLIKEINEGGVGKIEIYFKDKLAALHILTRETGQWITDPKHLLMKPAIKNKRKKIGVNRREKEVNRIFVATRSLDYYNRIIPKHG